MRDLARVTPHIASDEEVLARIDPAALPKHIAVIMDGNGRWARERRLPRSRGHEAGVTALRELVETAARLGVPTVTVFGFSVENWRRPESEVSALMRLGLRLLHEELPVMQENNVRFSAIGRIDDLDPMVRRVVRYVEEKTASNTGFHLRVAANYGGRAEIVDAVNAILTTYGHLDDAVIDEQLFARALYDSDVCDPDLVIRSAGEFRLSNFLLWQIAYSEVYVTPVLWPDFRRRDLYDAIIEFQSRERRFGGIAASDRGMFTDRSDEME